MDDALQTITDGEKEVLKPFTDITQNVSMFMNNFCSGNSKDKGHFVEDLINKVFNNNNDNVTNFSFTGKDTDLCYFNQSDTMPLSAISNISDQNIKNAVIDNFDKCINKGYLELKDGCLKITEKGKAEISKPSFTQSAKNDQMTAYNQAIEKMVKSNSLENTVQMGAVLNGDYMNDFTFFNHTDKMELSKIVSHPNKELSHKILANIKKWQKAGAVTVKDGVATVTDMGKKMLQYPQFQAATKNIAEKPITANNETAGIIVATKKVIGTVEQAVQSVSKSRTI